ncbi:MAG: aminodeoxychorismate synthase component I [Lewinellaceae bacterium]|nr:aminodeoxychorismate synthase component I [Saprospiraceae bacterium]MCB9312967.1 aminodeoxychorismate synthase component I [Lewinellaceae bacterium]HRW75116.1 aminodeoxychorismate synthase component I [Saprospiraceae bacterium]
MNTASPLFSQPIAYRDPGNILRQLRHLPGLRFLDSAQRETSLGRYSFLMADPFSTLIVREGQVYRDEVLLEMDPWSALKTTLDAFSFPADPTGPPFRGGAVGYLGYELNHTVEDLPTLPADHPEIPDLWIDLYDVVAVFDHVQQAATIYSSGFPEQDPRARTSRAIQRAGWLAGYLQPDGKDNSCENPSPALSWQSNFSREAYLRQVERIRTWIADGDIFQANFSQRFTAELPDGFDPLSFYEHARQINAAPFGAYFQYPGFTIASMSPERFLEVADRRVETRPIKGTRPRHGDVQEDLRLANELRNSVKDRSENTMIVDLLRNDLSKVCIPGSVQVPVLCGLESYASVHHLVSVVEGRLRPGLHAVDAIRAAFPGGSITGAPKKRAMEIIQEVEQIPRHVYCGSMGYWGFDGRMDSNIAIRTVLLTRQQAWFQSGGGIVYLSDAAEEFQESLDKAARIFTAFQP